MNTRELDSLENFQHVTKNYNVEINNNQLDLFKKYHEILVDWNKKINLISRKEENILERHFLDSILFLPEIESLVTQPTTNVLDIGSGGGFPAIPIAIIKSEWKFTLCESIKKKANFLNHLVKELDLDNVEILNTRVEACHDMPLQQKYDLITARAIAKLDVLIKYSMPLLKPGGSLIAYKAKDIEDELKNAEETIKKNKLKLKIFSKEIKGVERKLVVLTHSYIL